MTKLPLYDKNALAINLDDIEEIKLESDKTPTMQLDFTDRNTDKEEIMLKNMWEIENHPIFSSGGSCANLPLD